MAKSGISNLTFKLAKVFGKKSQIVFKTYSISSEIVDLLDCNGQYTQIEDIPHPCI